MKLNFSSVFSLYEIGAQVTATGPEPDPPVWKIYDAIDRQNGKVREEFIFVLCPKCFCCELSELHREGDAMQILNNLLLEDGKMRLMFSERSITTALC